MATKTHTTWQEELIGKAPVDQFKPKLPVSNMIAAECRKQRLPAPVFNIVSDRRGWYPLNSAALLPRSKADFAVFF